MRRVALIETVPEERHRHHGAEYFPFVLGWLRARGAVAEWWAFGVADVRLHAGASHPVDMPERAKRTLAQHLARFAPDTVVFHVRPAAALAGAVSAAAPRAKVVDLTRTPLDAVATLADVARLLGERGGRPGEDASALVLDVVDPCFERSVLDGVATCAAQAARLAGEVTCLYRRPVRDAPPYLGIAEAERYRGCAFCDRGAPHEGPVRRARTPPRELALRQIEAHQRDRAREGSRFEYLLDDGRIAADLAGLLEAAIERGIQPSTFYAMPRIDEVLRQAPRLRAVLPRARAAGHRTGLLSTGVENFSPDENARLNKGISPEQVWACRALLVELEEAFPGTFFAEPGVFAGILFTPWTQPCDLRANLVAARQLGRSWLERVMGTRLQLFPSTPITALARRDGLVADRLGSAGDVAAVCLSSPDAREIPWRFGDPRTELAHAILVRLDPIPFQAHVADDPLTSEVRGLRARLPTALAGDYVGLAAAVVDAVEALGADATAADVFRCIAASPAARAAPPAAPTSGAPPREASAPPGDDLRVVFADRRTGAARYVFRVGRAAPGAPAFRVVGATRVTYDRCTRDSAFQACASIVLAAVQRMGAPPARADHGSWERLVRALVDRSAVAGALEVACGDGAGVPR